MLSLKWIKLSSHFEWISIYYLSSYLACIQGLWRLGCISLYSCLEMKRWVAKTSYQYLIDYYLGNQLPQWMEGKFPQDKISILPQGLAGLHNPLINKFETVKKQMCFTIWDCVIILTTVVRNGIIFHKLLSTQLHWCESKSKSGRCVSQ